MPPIWKRNGKPQQKESVIVALLHLLQVLLRPPLLRDRHSMSRSPTPASGTKPPRASKRLIFRPLNLSISESISRIRFIMDSYTNFIRYNVLKGSRGDLIITFCSLKAVAIAAEAFSTHASDEFYIVPRPISSEERSGTWIGTKTSWEVKISPTPRTLDYESFCEEVKAEKYLILPRSKDLVLSFLSRETAARFVREGVMFEKLLSSRITLHVNTS